MPAIVIDARHPPPYRHVDDHDEDYPEDDQPTCQQCGAPLTTEDEIAMMFCATCYLIMMMIKE